MIDVLIDALSNLIKETSTKLTNLAKDTGKPAYVFFAIIVIASFFELQNLGIIPQNYFSSYFDIPTQEKDPIIKTFYKVSRVVDGDTLELDMSGRKEKVRLIGINTPETVDPRKSVECFGKEASERMKQLANGNLVYLEYDDTQSLRDKYDRLLAYVYLEDDQMLNRKMIAEGYAHEYTYGSPYKYQKEFRELQNFARNQARGLWSPDSCNGNN